MVFNGSDMCEVNLITEYFWGICFIVGSFSGYFIHDGIIHILQEQIRVLEEEIEMYKQEKKNG